MIHEWVTWQKAPPLLRWSFDDHVSWLCSLRADQGWPVAYWANVNSNLIDRAGLVEPRLKRLDKLWRIRVFFQGVYVIGTDVAEVGKACRFQARRKYPRFWHQQPSVAWVRDHGKFDFGGEY
jgi:hypothetical protein